MRLSIPASPMSTNKLCTSLVLKQNKRGGSAARQASGGFRVFAVKAENNVINRLEGQLNLDVTPYIDRIIAEYIWIGGSGIDLRSKSRTISKPVKHPSELPKWNYDGSSTGQAPGEDSEVILYPQAIFKDPFRGGNNILVICDAYTPAGEPIPTNKRARAAEIFSEKKVLDEVRNRAGVHIASNKCTMAFWLACWRLPGSSGSILLRSWGRQVIWPRHIRCPLQSLLICRGQHQQNQW